MGQTLSVLRVEHYSRACQRERSANFLVSFLTIFLSFFLFYHYQPSRYVTLGLKGFYFHPPPPPCFHNTILTPPSISPSSVYIQHFALTLPSLHPLIHSSDQIALDKTDSFNIIQLYWKGGFFTTWRTDSNISLICLCFPLHLKGNITYGWRTAGLTVKCKWKVPRKKEHTLNDV